MNDKSKTFDKLNTLKAEQFGNFSTIFTPKSNVYYCVLHTLFSKIFTIILNNCRYEKTTI